MPVKSTNAAMGVNGWLTLDTNSTPPQSTINYFESFDFKPNTASANSLVSNLYSSQYHTYMYGKDNAKSYIVGFNSNGNINFNLSTTNAALVPTSIAVDNGGYTHILIGATKELMKYDVAGTKVLHKIVSFGVGNIGRFIAIDSVGNLYMLTSNGTTYFTLLRLDTNYNVVWAKAISQGGTTGVGTVNKIEFDQSNNIYVILDDFVYIFDSAGTLTLQRKILGSVHPLAQVTSVDPGGNILILSGVDYLKVSNAGVKIFEKTTNINFSNGNIVSSTLDGSGRILGLTSTLTTGKQFKIVTFTTDNSPVFIANTVYNDTAVVAPYYETQQIDCTNTNSFVKIRLDSQASPGRYTQATMRLPLSGSLLSINTTYSFNVTADNGTTYTYTGNIQSSTGNNVSLSNATNWNISTPTFTTSNVTVTLSNGAASFTTLTPTEYVLSLP